MKFHFLLVLVSCFAIACQSSDSSEEKIATATTYTADQIGWTIPVPADWEHVSADSTDSDDEIMDLLHIKKNEVNTLSATIEPFDSLEFDVNWTTYTHLIKEMMYQTYEKDGFSVDTSASRTVLIDGQPFEMYHIDLSQNNEPYAQQVLFSAFINDLDFNVVLTSMEDKPLADMKDLFLKSTFQAPN